MYKVLKDNKIVGVVDNWSETDKKYHPDLIIEEDTEHTVDDYMMVGVEYVLISSEKAIEEKKQQIRTIRDSMIVSMTWRLERAKEQRELGIEPVDDIQKLLEYRQYLRDYPDTVEKWWEQQPMTYEDWTEENIKETGVKEEE